jgi:hypothetical protein
MIREKYNTKELVGVLAKIIVEEWPQLVYIHDFAVWKVAFQSMEPEIRSRLPSYCEKDFPLSEDVKKMAVWRVTGFMPFSKNFVIANYEKNHRGIDYLFYPSESPKRLIVIFSGLSSRKSYNRFSWYWDESQRWVGDTAYLFLNDLAETWYCGTPSDGRLDIYSEIITRAMSELGLSGNRVFSLGASMGGYAAILFGIIHGFNGVLSVNAQVNKKYAALSKSSEWLDKMSLCGDCFIDLECFASDAKSLPKLYIQYGQYEADRKASESIVRAFQGRTSMLITSILSDETHVVDKPTRGTIESCISLFSSDE